MKKGWEVKTLGEVCDVFTDGDWIEKKDQATCGIRLIQTGNIGNGVFLDRIDKARYISEETFKCLRCTEVLPNDCLLSRLPDPVGRAGIIPDLGAKMITAVDCTIMRFNKSILPKWFIYYSLSSLYQNEINKAVSGATRQRISRSNLGNVSIPIASFPEQKRIVGVLDKAFAAIDKAKENAEKNLANARELFESYLQSVFANPSPDWEVKKLGEIAEVKGGKRVPKGYRFEGNKTKYPYISVSSFTDTGTIDSSEVKYISNIVFEKIKQYTITSEDLYISIAGTIGKTGMVPAEFNGSNLTENACKLVLQKKVNVKFIYYFTRTCDFKIQTGVNTRVAAQPKLSLDRLKTITLPLPPISEQKRIVAKLDALSAETKKLEAVYQQKLADLDELKKSILQKAFNGEL